MVAILPHMMLLGEFVMFQLKMQRLKIYVMHSPNIKQKPKVTGGNKVRGTADVCQYNYSQYQKLEWEYPLCEHNSNLNSSWLGLTLVTWHSCFDNKDVKPQTPSFQSCISMGQERVKQWRGKMGKKDYCRKHYHLG